MKRFEQYEGFEMDWDSTNPNIIGSAIRYVVAVDDATPFDDGEIIAVEVDGHPVGPGNPVPDISTYNS